MNELTRGLLTVFSIAVAVPLFLISAPATETQAANAPLRYGLDSSSTLILSKEGLTTPYGALWVGPWTLVNGWGGTDSRLDQLRAAGVTPYVQFYYWGDDLSPSCLENGCWSSLHDVQKDQAGWDRLRRELGTHLQTKMKGAPVVIVLETEFNKGKVATYEPLDGLLTTKAQELRADYPAATVVLGFGNWGRDYWKTFDRAAAASDAIGLQGMRGSTRHSAQQYSSVVEETMAGVRFAKTSFARPIHITDLALSSYPDWEAAQNETLARMLAKAPELQAEGVQALVYRDLVDSPTMDTANYFGEAERYWGLRTHDGRDKPAYETWKRAAFPAPVPTSASPPVTSSSTTTTAAATTSATAPTTNSTQATASTTAPSTTSSMSTTTTAAPTSSTAPTTSSAAASPSTTTAAPSTTTQPSPSPTTTSTKPLVVIAPPPLVQLPPPPPTPLPSAQTEAESFQIHTSGGVENDLSASGRARWNLWTNGHIGHWFMFPAAGQYEIRVRAQGTTVDGVAPQMMMKAGSKTLLYADPSPGWTTYGAKVYVDEPGARLLEIHYENDVMKPPQDRNLMVDFVTIQRVG